MPKNAGASFDDTWFTLGMRGTGSKDVVLDSTCSFLIITGCG